MTLLLAQIDVSMLAGNPMLSRLGAALVHFLWQGAAGTALALVLLGLLKRSGPQLRYAVLVCVLATMAACPAVTFWRIASVARPDAPDSARSSLSTASADAAADGNRFSGGRLPLAADLMPVGAVASTVAPPAPANLPKAAIWERLVEQGRGGLRASIHWLALAWCAGVVVLSLRLAMGIVGVERAKRTGARPAAAIDATVAALTRRLRVSRPVRVLQSTLAEVPTTIGWLRPYILLPASAMTGLSTSELEAVLAHELAHVRRHDYVVNVAQIVVETLLFYHPAVWWLSGRIRREREHCCDDWAVAVCGNRMTFARALVTLEGLRGPAGRLALAASGGSLRERVLRLVGRPARHSASRSGWWAAAVVVLATLAAIGIGAVASPRALGTTPPNTDAAEAASGVGSPPEAETAKTEGEPAKTMRIFLQAAVGKQLTLETRKVERPSAPPEVVTHVDRGARITIDEPSGPKLRIAAERISLTLSADAGIKLRGGDLQASFPPDTMAQVSCNGNVRVEWGETTLAAETIELNLGEERLVASGRVRVVHRETRIEADKVQFIFADGRFEIQGAEVFGGTAVDKLSATTWGDVRNGWQLGLRWKLGHVEHAVGEEAWYEVVARNPGQNAIMVPVTKGEHSDVTLYAGNKIQIRIHGGERENVVLLPGEERVLDVWRSRLSTDGLAEGEYKVAVRTADDDVPPPLGLRLTAPSTPREPGAPRDLKGSAVADTGEPEADPETIAWGEPVLGLQAGVRFVTSLSRRKSRNLIEAQVFVCNTTEREVEIEYLHHTPLDFAPVVRDGDGRELEALLILTGPKFNETRVLPPGRPVLVGTAQFEFRSRDGDVQSSPSIIGPPGKYHYSTWLHIGGTNLAHVGIRLTTGELPLELAENAVEADGAAAPNADETGGVSGEGAVDIKTPFDGRMPANRRILVEIGGGSAASEAAVEKALDWIRRHQNRDGSWSIHAYDRQCKDQTCTGQGASHSDVGATAMGLLPLLGAGWTHQSKESPYAKAIDNGLQYLIGNQEASGNLAGRAFTMYAHGLATIALSEAYGMTKDPDLGKAAEAAVRFIEAAQHPTTGGWRYTPGEEGDTSVVGWQVTALKGAQFAGIEVKDATFDGARRFLTSASAGEAKGLFSYTPGSIPTPTMTASGLLCTQHLGIPRDSPRMKEGVDMLMRHLPAPEQRSIYYWHYANQVMHNLPGSQWDEWNRKMQAALIESQVTSDGNCADGSWDPQRPFPDPWGNAGGRLMTTSLSCLALEVYYRYLPLYRAENVDGK